MVFVGRILDGFTAGNLSIAQAYISDHTHPENRAKAFGVIGVAFGIGFMFGPGLGGMLGKFGLHVPFLVAAGLSVLSMICTYALLTDEKPDDTHPGGHVPATRRPGAFDIAAYAAYFRRPGLGSLYLQFFLFAFAFSCFMSGFALFAERRFTVAHDVARIPGTCQLAVEDRLELPHAALGTLALAGEPLAYETQWVIVDPNTIELRGDACARIDTAPPGALDARFPWTAHEVGLLFVFSGILGIILQGGLLGRLVKRFGEVKLTISGFVAGAAGYALLGFTHTLALLLVVIVLKSFSNGVMRPALTSRITQVAGRAEQGSAIGISGSLSSFAMMLAPPTGGILLNHHWLVAWALVPAVTAALGIIVAVATRPRATPAGIPPASELSSAP
jgi:MFS family permease